MKYQKILLLSFLLCIGCGTSQPVRVLQEGKTEAALSLGGPLIKFGGATIPMPYLTVGAIHGYKENVTLVANAHLLSAALGDIGLDAGAATRLVKQDNVIPEVTAKALLYFFDNLSRGPNQPRLFPMISFNASYTIGESSLAYVGFDNIFQLSSPGLIISPFIGTEFYISNKFSGQIEAKWYAANVNSAHGIYEGYASVGGNGNIGLLFGLVYNF